MSRPLTTDEIVDLGLASTAEEAEELLLLAARTGAPLERATLEAAASRILAAQIFFLEN